MKTPPQLVHNRPLLWLFISTIFLCPSCLLANPPQVLVGDIGYPSPLSTATTFPITITLLHDASTTITVTFTLLNDNGTRFPLGTAVYSTHGQTTVNLFLPSQCYTPASQWRVYATAAGQTMFGSFSESPTSFSIRQDPTSIQFVPYLSGNYIVVSQNPASTVSDSQFSTVETLLYVLCNVANVGCAPSSNYQIQLNFDALQSLAVMAILGGQTDNIPATIRNITPGYHTVSFAMLSPTGTLVATTPPTTFFVAEPPTINAQPANLTVRAGDTATFIISAIGVPTPTYQWSYQNSKISGATDATYQIPHALAKDAGTYVCKVSNSAGNSTSTGAILVVTTPPAAKLNALTLAPGGKSLQVSVNGQPGLTHVLQASTDMRHWNSVSSFINSAQNFTMSVPIPDNSQNTWFRISTKY